MFADQGATIRDHVLFAQEWPWYRGVEHVRYASTGIFDGRHKYCRYYGVGGGNDVTGRPLTGDSMQFGRDAAFEDQEHELYDLQEDPNELVNLAMDLDRRPEVRQRFAELRAIEHDVYGNGILIMRARPLRPVTDDEITAFHRDGAVLLPGILPDEWVQRALAGLDAAVEEPDVMSSDLGTLRVDQFPAAKSPDLRAMVDESPLAEIVGTVLDSPVCFYMDQLFAKPAGLIPPTPWHQDTCYYNVDGHDLIRAWVSPDPVPRRISLEVVKGSHRWNATYAPLAGRDVDTDPAARETFEAATADAPVLGADTYEDWNYFTGVRDKTLPPVPSIDDHRDSFDIIGWDYQPGDVILFHGHILHSALGGVVSGTPRRAHASLWAGSDVHYLHRAGQIIPDPIALYDHQPRSGQPLTDFPDVFPVLWSPAMADSGDTAS